MIDVTLKKFEYPETLVKEYKHWYLLRRFEQATLGSLILICKEQTDAFSKISSESFAELEIAVHEIESNLKKLFQNDKINYLMLMMVDPEVHFHIIPRYASNREFDGIIFTDVAWPKKIDIDVINKVNEETLEKLTMLLREGFSK